MFPLVSGPTPFTVLTLPSPLSPFGIPKVNTGAISVPDLETVAEEPGSKVVALIEILGVMPGSPLSAVIFSQFLILSTALQFNFK